MASIDGRNEQGRVQTCILKAAQQLGYASMKPAQLEVTINFIRGRDVFAILPTGFGKSLCYACFPTAFDAVNKKERGHSIVVVVTPLLAIMKDQVRTYSVKGLFSAYVSGEVTDKAILDGVALGHYQLVFFTPEMLITNKRWRRVIESDLYADRLEALVVDEAHCVKKWGDTFRIVLKRIGEVRSLIPPRVRVMALTATATKSDQLAISRTLGLRNPFVLTRCPTSANLIYSVGAFTSVYESLKLFASKLKREKALFPKTIIYGRTFAMCSNIYLFLKEMLGQDFLHPIDAPDIPQFRIVDMFTSITEPDHKSMIIKAFKADGHLRVVVAIVTFGMGVDCPNIRQVVHIGIPDDISSYIQESGRAGRDGRPAMATLLKARVNHVVDNDIKDYVANLSTCRRDALFGSMDNYTPLNLDVKCLCCDVCCKLCQCGDCVNNLKIFASFL